MGKGRRNQRNPDYYKVQGKPVEDRAAARESKQALAAQAARVARRAGGKTALGEAPPEQHRAEPRRKAAPARTRKAAGRRPEAAPPSPPPPSRRTRSARWGRRLLGAAAFALGRARALMGRVRRLRSLRT